jgi:hypothetical protein
MAGRVWAAWLGACLIWVAAPALAQDVKYTGTAGTLTVRDGAGMPMLSMFYVA